MENTKPPRITFRHVNGQLLEAFNLEKGLFYTLYALTLRPGKAIREYLLDDRTRLIPPLRLLFLSVAIAAFLTVTFIDFSSDFSAGFMEGYQMGNALDGSGSAPPELENITQRFQQIYQNYFNVFLLLGVPLLGLVSFWVVRKGFFFAEHLVINAYATSWMNILYICLIPLFRMDYLAVSTIYMLVAMPYIIFVYYQVFELKLWESIWKGIVVNILYLILYIVLLSVLISIFIAVT